MVEVGIIIIRIFIMTVVRKVLNWYARLSPSYGVVKPPYKHVVQIGDPRLRKVSELVPLDKIKSGEVQKVIRHLEYVLNKYESVGMSAPQIGVNLRIFVMRVIDSQIRKEPVSKAMTTMPLSVFINPSMKVVDYQKIIHSEGCESVRGFFADTARYKEVSLLAYNKEGQQITKVYKDWTARIVQHEMDHLNGKLYTDIMDRKTLHCGCWEEVNTAQGKLAIPFMPD